MTATRSPLGGDAIQSVINGRPLPRSNSVTGTVVSKRLTQPGFFRLDTEQPSFGQITEIRDLGADARYVYAAALNTGGIFALQKTSMATAHPYTGNVWNLAVDDDGVYFGEHDPSAAGGAGTIYMLVKK